MHVRESKVRKGDKTYRYVQLVESFRRKDGVPATRVLASFGDLSESQTQTVRTFAKAFSAELRLRLDDEEPSAPARLHVLDNLAYLHLAVLREVWQAAGLDGLLQRVLQDPGRHIPCADVVTALVLHRCVAADSKLAAERWVPTTALPELFGWAPEKFNNSRVHRVMDLLEQHDQDLQDALPGIVRSRYGPATALLIDGTDTWFEGRGPDIASTGRVKDGTFRRKILIIVGCDHRGFPLRWRVYEGRTSEVHALRDVALDIARSAWLGDAPLIADRALGNYASLEILANTGRNYLVPVPDHEVAGWVPKLAGLPLDLAERAEVERAVERLGFTRVDARTFVADGAPYAAADGPPPGPPVAPTPIAAALAQARQMAGGGSHAAIAAQYRVSKSHVGKLLALLQLPDDVKQRIDAGEGASLAVSGLIDLLRQHTDEAGRRMAFDALLTTGGRKGKRLGKQVVPETGAGPVATPRAAVGRPILYFNLDIFVEQRQRANEKLREVQAAVAALCPGTDGPERVDRILREHGMVSVFKVVVTDGVVGVTLNEAAWARRRRFDGFSVLVASPGLTSPPAELVALYRQRCEVERDFRTIKSVVQLRPVHHRTDAKVRAHVTICVLATLLHRLLEHHLATAGVDLSASAALAQLGLCHLNRIRRERGAEVTHLVTQVQEDIRNLLVRLELERLVDEDQVVNTISPR
ncbi:MAG: transposase [Myxococcota bacterium]